MRVVRATAAGSEVACKRVGLVLGCNCQEPSRRSHSRSSRPVRPVSRP